MIRAIYVDVDGTLVGPGGTLFPTDSTAVIDGLLSCRAAGVAVVPVSGRGRVQMRELCRLLDLPRGIGELGCVHIEGRQVSYETGEFPPSAGSSPVDALLAGGAVDLVCAAADLEPHDPWNEGREVTYLLRGDAEPDDVDEVLSTAGFGWCQLTDNGVLARGGRAYHLAPRGTGKAVGVATDRERHGLSVADTAYIGDSAADLACRAEVGQLWLVANADPALADAPRTSQSYGDGVAEVISRLLG